MIVLGWNVRGINDPLKQGDMKKEVNKYCPTIFTLIETRVKMHKAQTIARRIFPHYSFTNNYNAHYNGRIRVFWVFWLPVLSVTVTRCSNQLVHCESRMETMASMVLSPLFMGITMLDNSRPYGRIYYS